MKRSYDEKVISTLLMAHHILDNFDSRELSFYLTEYEAGEVMISPLEKIDHLQFVVSGLITIYAIRSDGSRYVVLTGKEEMLLGDMEFVNHDRAQFWVEARTKVTCVCLSISDNRPKLMKDITFLHYVMRALVDKLKMSSDKEASFTSLDEKIIDYIRHRCIDQTLTHVSHAAAELHISRRHLQRMLGKLVTEGSLIHPGVGIYRCNECQKCARR